MPRTPEEFARMRATLARARDPRPSGQPRDVASIRAWWRTVMAGQRRRRPPGAPTGAQGR